MNNTHINFHCATGLIIASIFHSIFNFTLIEFTAIVFSAFVMDFDIFLSKFAKDNNHRMLITHSIIPSIGLLILGLIMLSPVIFICGLAYLIHIFIDTLDWGTNFLGIHKKPFGPKFLITKEELENIDEILSKYKIKKSFFDLRYYKSRGILFTEGIFFVVMMFSVILFAIEFILLIILYTLFLAFHISGYLHFKKIEAAYQS